MSNHWWKQHSLIDLDTEEGQFSFFPVLICLWMHRREIQETATLIWKCGRKLYRGAYIKLSFSHDAEDNSHSRAPLLLCTVCQKWEHVDALASPFASTYFKWRTSLEDKYPAVVLRGMLTGRVWADWQAHNLQPTQTHMTFINSRASDLVGKKHIVVSHKQLPVNLYG